MLLLGLASPFMGAQTQSASQPAASPVWQMEESGTTAGLRGIYSVDGQIAWASGTEGTVLRTVDGGQHWQRCATPDGDKDGATLDFRGVQAWDAKTAIVMASGPGEKSRLYKTTDGCGTWKLLFTNPDKDGFWDAVRFDGHNDGMILGDPVKGAFAVFVTFDGGENWKGQKLRGLKADFSRQAVFAASNSSLLMWTALSHRIFVSGGKGGAFVYECYGELSAGAHPENVDCLRNRKNLPLSGGIESAGAFSVDYRPLHSPYPEIIFKGGGGTYQTYQSMVVVGGDYMKPSEATGTAAYSVDFGDHWTASQQPPHGYRSSVQWSEQEKLWITVGTNGSDVSRDDGKTWQPVDDGNWNALSLPLVVGPKGRIARLNPVALPKP
ncbi:MAG: hypothetical protein P4L03_10210 [Terracidiphilus sp.]|nr:hypothetical protein [Terracidiphilus sp.]